MTFRHSMLIGATFLGAALGAHAQAPTGAELLQEGQTARAIAQLENALGRNPFDPVVLNNLAVAYAEAGDYRRAAELLQRAQRLAPGEAPITENLHATENWLAHLAERGARASEDAEEDGGEPLRVPPAPPQLWR